MEQGTFEEFHDDRMEKVLDKPKNVEVLTIRDDSSSKEQAYVFQGLAYENIQGDDLGSDDLDSYIREVVELEFSPTIESPMAKRDPYEENPVVDMGFVTKVAEQILNEGLETLFLAAQKCSNPKKAMIIWMDLLKRTSANKGKSFVPQEVDNSHHNLIATQSRPIYFFDVIFLLDKKLNFKREKWKQQKKELTKIIDSHYQETLVQEEKVEQLSVKLDKITSLIPDLMGCRSPSPIYALFLKEQLLNYQMTCIMQDRTPSLKEPTQFFCAFHNSLVTIKNLLCELYLHNLAVLDDRVWNPLCYVGDIQLRVFMSQIQNEISWNT